MGSSHSIHLNASPHMVQKQGNAEESSPTVGSLATSVVIPAVADTVEPNCFRSVQCVSNFWTAWQALQT